MVRVTITRDFDLIHGQINEPSRLKLPLDLLGEKTETRGLSKPNGHPSCGAFVIDNVVMAITEHSQSKAQRKYL